MYLKKWNKVLYKFYLTIDDMDYLANY